MKLADILPKDFVDYNWSEGESFRVHDLNMRKINAGDGHIGFIAMDNTSRWVGTVCISKYDWYPRVRVRDEESAKTLSENLHGAFREGTINEYEQGAEEQNQSKGGQIVASIISGTACLLMYYGFFTGKEACIAWGMGFMALAASVLIGSSMCHDSTTAKHEFRAKFMSDDENAQSLAFEAMAKKADKIVWQNRNVNMKLN